MGKASAARAGTLFEVSLSLTEPEAALLAPRSPAAPQLVAALLAHPSTAQWATRDDLSAAAKWLGAAASELSAPAIADRMTGEAHHVVAEWRWPDHPLVDVRLDGSTIAKVDYLPASASAHWFLRWTGEPRPAHGRVELPLIPLATRVPEEAEEEAGMRTVVLDTAVEAAANELTGRAVRLELRDA